MYRLFKTDISVNSYWINQGAINADLWAHEFSKHATCFSTFDVPCYGPKYVEHQEVIEFWQTSVDYFRNLPTYDWLSDAGITPCNETTYSLSDIEGALTKEYHAKPYIGCSGPRYNETTVGKGSNDTGRTVVSEVWYYFHVSRLSARRAFPSCRSRLLPFVGEIFRRNTLLTSLQAHGRPQNNDPKVLDSTGPSSCAKVAKALTYPTRSNGSEKKAKVPF